jgi:hypothetical protein
MRGILVVFYISPGSFGKDSALMEPPQKVLMRSSGLAGPWQGSLGSLPSPVQDTI